MNELLYSEKFGVRGSSTCVCGDLVAHIDVDRACAIDGTHGIE